MIEYYEQPLPIRTYDIDFAGIVSNIVFVRWLEDLRLGLLDQADRELDEHLAGLTVEDLTEDRPRKDQEPKPGLLWLISNYGHAREHLAQIELTKQLYDSRT